MIDFADSLGDGGGENVPTALAVVFGIEVVRTIFTGTPAVLDDVLGGVSDDDSKISVALHPPLGDGFDGTHSALVVDGGDRIDDIGREFARLRERSPPLGLAVVLGFSRDDEFRR